MREGSRPQGPHPTRVRNTCSVGRDLFWPPMTPGGRVRVGYMEGNHTHRMHKYMKVHVTPAQSTDLSALS